MRKPKFPTGILPATLRGRLFLVLAIAISIPIISTGYVLERKGRQALLEEKTAKLFGLTKIMDSYLGSDFGTIMKEYRGDPGDRIAKIRFLNERLRDFTDRIAEANPGVGVGYYDMELNAAITYGPSQEYGSKVGEILPVDHPGWQVMAKGQPAIETGPMARGHIMNAMWPVIREGRVMGYIWANEFTAAVEKQALAMDRALIVVVSFGLVLSLALSFFMAQRLTRDIGIIKFGLNRMKLDLRKPIRQLKGEMGEISSAVNEMARALIDARSLTENILWSIADGVITVDVDGNITSINPAGQEIMGVTPERAIGRPYESLLDREANFTSFLLDTLKNGNEYVSVNIDVPLHDKTLFVSTSTSLLRDGSGNIIGAVAVFKDISETRQLQKQVMRADRLAALGELVAGIAHDIRNPLTSIRGFVQYLQKSRDPEELMEYGPLIIRQVDGLNRTIGELLKFAKPSPPQYGPVQVNDLIGETMRLIRNRAAKQNVEIELELDPELPMIRADGEQLKQVLLNLLINSGQAMSSGGRILIRTSMETSGKLVIEVADNGAGIATQHLEKIFDPFFSTKPAGTGLGLAVVNRIISGHNGVIGIESELGKGTTVTIQLPGAPSDMEETQEA
ncbi:MAG: two-component system sensor histidine kinase AtoS [Syntrophaceae bacterium]|nr:two-component system sensor histidine kinase AtoS [Syntrophaceae bacterium]